MLVKQITVLHNLVITARFIILQCHLHLCHSTMASNAPVQGVLISQCTLTKNMVIIIPDQTLTVSSPINKYNCVLSNSGVSSAHL